MYFKNFQELIPRKEEIQNLLFKQFQMNFNQIPSNAPNFTISQPKDEEVCLCENPARKVTVKKEGPNNGREFYTCANNQCKFFKWADFKASHQKVASPKLTYPEYEKLKEMAEKFDSNNLILNSIDKKLDILLDRIQY
jgi:hypothetical protein